MKLKKGLYYVGDPCYIFDKSWKSFLNKSLESKDNIINIFGEECCVGKTTFGDGRYFDQFDNMYGVDSGLLGILPISFIEQDKKINLELIEKSGFMCVHEFIEDFEVNINNGLFTFGKFIINTNDEEYIENARYIDSIQ